MLGDGLNDHRMEKEELAIAPIALTRPPQKPVLYVIIIQQVAAPHFPRNVYRSPHQVISTKGGLVLLSLKAPLERDRSPGRAVTALFAKQDRPEDRPGRHR